jgi:hypothetical protein
MRSDAAFLVPKDDELFAEQFHPLWQIGEPIRGDTGCQ